MSNTIGSVGSNIPITTSMPMAETGKKEEAAAAAPKDGFKKNDVESKIWKGVKGFGKTLGAGFGLGSGAAGGFAIGGTVAATGFSLASLFSHSFTLAGAGSAGLVGGVAGAVVFGACGMLGGYQIGDKVVEGAHKLYDFAKDKLTSH